MLNRFFFNHSGNVAVTTGLLFIPLVLAAAVAVDYSKVYKNKSQAQQAADAAALAVARQGGDNQEELLQLANAFLDSNFLHPQGVEITAQNLEIFTTNAGNQYKVSVAFEQQTSFLRIAGINTVDPVVSSVAGSSANALEIALVLDSTGSMGSNNKIQELKSAVSIFADQFETAQNVSVAIIPFDTQVRLNNVSFGSPDLDNIPNPYDSGTDCNDLSGEERNICQDYQATCVAGSSDDDDDDDDHSTPVGICAQQPNSSKNNDTISANNDLLGATGSEWSGCVIDRAKPFDVSSDKTNPAMSASLYPTAHCATNSLKPILPLTKNFAVVRNHVNSLQPAGNTNLTIGVQWGMEVLTQPRPFNESQVAGNASTTRQIMVLVTDGQNTQNRWTTETSDIDNRSLIACESAKSLVDDVYTVRIVNGNAALLEQCASSAEHFYNITSATELDNVFEDIARKISSVRLIN